MPRAGKRIRHQGCGSSELSSASDSAPQMLIRPNAVHSPMMTRGFGTSPAIVGGVRKMPLPIVMPTISAVPPENPMTRRRSWPTETPKVYALASPRHIADAVGTPARFDTAYPLQSISGTSFASEPFLCSATRASSPRQPCPRRQLSRSRECILNAPTPRSRDQTSQDGLL